MAHIDKMRLQEEMAEAIETLEKAEKNAFQFLTGEETRTIKRALDLVIPIESRLYNEIRYGDVDNVINRVEGKEAE